MKPTPSIQSQIDERHAFTVNQRSAELRWKHARSCKKNPFECEACKSTIMWFGEVPDHHLSEILAEVPSQRATFQFATLIIESTFNRGTQLSKRAEADKVEGMRLLKWYEDEGGKIRH